MSPRQPTKYNVLVFPCASGIAQEVFFALRDKKEFELHGLNRAGANVGRSLFDNYHETEHDIVKTPEGKGEKNVLLFLFSVPFYSLKNVYASLRRTRER